ncbi:MAG: Ppx/GppA phosphatase family protein [Bdellovibrionia bacterium]
MSKKLFTFVFAALSYSFILSQTSCANLSPKSQCQVQNHALFDLGSGSTKLSVFETNSCSPSIKMLHKKSLKVDYKEDLILSGDKKEFSEKIQSVGKGALRELKDEAKKFNPKSHRGVATAAFREATNGQLVINSFQKDLGIELEIISQEREAQLALLAVANHVDPKTLLVWDIGGGSFQFVSFGEDSQKVEIFEGQLASVSFKEKVINEIKKKAQSQSPNPLSLKEVEAARALVQTELKEKLTASFLKAKSKEIVVGIGGVHYSSLRHHLKKDEFTAHDIDEWISLNHRKKDKQLHDNYASTVVTNMILVSEIMKILEIPKIKAMNVSLVEGLLVQNPSQSPLLKK